MSLKDKLRKTIPYLIVTVATLIPPAICEVTGVSESIAKREMVRFRETYKDFPEYYDKKLARYEAIDTEFTRYGFDVMFGLTCGVSAFVGICAKRKLEEWIKSDEEPKRKL